MDTNTVITNIRTRYDFELGKKLLQEKYRSKLLVIQQGGYFIADHLLIAYLRQETSERVILQDEYKNVVEVQRVPLLDEMSRTYNSVMKQWHTEYQELRSRR
jgi:hypothetical protein